MEDSLLGKKKIMIYDTLKNIGRYNFLKKIEKFDFSNYQKGKFDIDDEGFFGIGLEYDTKNESDCLWEAHQKHLDIHFVIEGEEIIHITDISNTEETKEYDTENDYALFTAEKEQKIILKQGEFLVLYPNEVHQTAVKLTNTSSVKKIVFKIKI